MKDFYKAVFKEVGIILLSIVIMTLFVIHRELLGLMSYIVVLILFYSDKINDYLDNDYFKID